MKKERSPNELSGRTNGQRGSRMESRVKGVETETPYMRKKDGNRPGKVSGY